MSQKVSRYVTEAITTKISFDDARAILAEAALLPKDRRDFYGLFAIMMGRFKGKEFDEVSRTVFALMQRIDCLSKMCKTQKMKAWMLESGLDDGSILIREDIVKATALCPLRHDRKIDKLFFDEAEFFDIALKECETEGAA